MKRPEERTLSEFILDETESAAQGRALLPILGECGVTPDCPVTITLTKGVLTGYEYFDGETPAALPDSGPSQFDEVQSAAARAYRDRDQAWEQRAAAVAEADRLRVESLELANLNARLTTAAGGHAAAVAKLKAKITAIETENESLKTELMSRPCVDSTAPTLVVCDYGPLYLEKHAMGYMAAIASGMSDAGKHGFPEFWLIPERGMPVHTTDDPGARFIQRVVRSGGTWYSRKADGELVEVGRSQTSAEINIPSTLGSIARTGNGRATNGRPRT